MSSDEKASIWRRIVSWEWSALVVTLVVVMVCFYTWANKTVVLDMDGNRTTVQTFSFTVGSLLQSQDVALLEKDTVYPALDTRVQQDMTVTVKRAAVLNIAVDGTEIPARTQQQTVADVLKEYRIILGPEDEVEPAWEAPICSGMTVKVARINTESVSLIAPIAYETVEQYTVNLPSGSSRVTQEGKEGAENQTWLITYRDGQEVEKNLVTREVIEAPVNRIVVYGSTMVASRGGEDIRYSQSLDMLASAYTYTGNNTASGVAPYYGVAAVDTSQIPLGTKLYVEGYGHATALDRGGAIRGNRIDLFFGTRGEAMNWGLRWVKVYVLD